MKALRALVALYALASAFAGTAGLAAGPLVICNAGSIPIKYASNSVTLNYDLGNLGTRSKATADAIVTSAVALWTNVATSNLVIGRGADLPVDVTSANWATYVGNGTFGDGLNPVVYDTDGTIIDAMLGTGASDSVLGIAGSNYFLSPTCAFAEGRAVISGKLSVSDATMSIVFAHEVGHLVGLDHTQIDNATIPGLTAANFPLMYPIAVRNTPSVGEDDKAAVSALYPDATLGGTYGQLSGTLTLADGVTPVKGANIVAINVADTTKAYSVVSDYLVQSNGFFKLLLPAGTYKLLIEAIDSSFTGGSSVGPYSELSTDPSFQPPLYVGGVPMATVTLGGSATPTQFTIIAGCMATLPLRLDGTGTVSGNCTAPPPATGKIGVFRGGFWFVDKNGDNTWNGTPTDGFFAFGSPTDIPVVGDWNGDGKAKIGVFRDGFFFLDYNGNGVWEGGAIDRFYAFGTVGDQPVVGDWNGDGKAKIGVFRGGFFFLDYNGNGLWEGYLVDRGLAFGLATDTPVIGDWNGSGTSKIGVFRSGFFFLDYNGNGVWEGHLVDRGLAFGAATDTPVIDDWNGSGTSKVGVFRSGFWFTDLNGSGVWDGTPTDQFFAFGTTGDKPVAGKGW